jgi:hypothetical protein
VALRTPLTGLVRHYHLVMHRDKQVTPVMRRFVDLVLGTAGEAA